jgi:pimeloyl-ACP methyl ester carboxylesterase
VAVVGLSGGGSHVLALTALGEGLVRRGVAINPGPPSDPHVLAVLPDQTAKLIALARTRPRVFRVIADVLQAHGNGPVGRLADRLRRRQLDPSDAAVLERPEMRPIVEAAALEGGVQPHAWRTEALMLWQQSWDVPLDRFAAPLDVYVGADDPFRRFGEGLARGGATIHVFPGGHVSGFVPEVMREVMALAARD